MFGRPIPLSPYGIWNICWCKKVKWPIFTKPLGIDKDHRLMPSESVWPSPGFPDVLCSLWIPRASGWNQETLGRKKSYLALNYFQTKGLSAPKPQGKRHSPWETVWANTWKRLIERQLPRLHDLWGGDIVAKVCGQGAGQGEYKRCWVLTAGSGNTW